MKAIIRFLLVSLYCLAPWASRADKQSSYPTTNAVGDNDLIPILAAQAGGVYSNRNVTPATLKAKVGGAGSVDVSTLLNPPHVGNGIGYDIWNGDTRTNGMQMIVPAGSSGVIRTIAYETGNEPGYSGFYRRTNLNLRIWPDCGTVTTSNPPSPFVDIPIGALVSGMYRFQSNGLWSVHFDTDYLKVSDSTNAFLPGALMFNLTLPVFFTNGCAIALWNTTANKPWTNGFMSVGYELGALTDPLAKWRLRTDTYIGTPTVGVSNLLLTTKGSSGLTVGVLQSLCSDDVLIAAGVGGLGFVGSWCEQPVQFVGADGLIWKSSGQDDFFANSYTFVNDGVSFGWHYGTPNFYTDPSAQVCVAEAYRWFNRDAWLWQGPMKVVALPDNANGPNPTVVCLTVVYYSTP